MMPSLRIFGLELQVNLGWPEEEKIKKQTIIVDIEIIFESAPQACTTDELKDTLCYSTLIHALQQDIVQHQFRLIESFTNYLYEFVKSHLKMKAAVVIKVTKFPKIAGLMGGVQFSHGDID